MQTININTALFKTLKDDYKLHKDKDDKQSILRAGMDYMEAMVKLYSVISFSMLKDIDSDKAKKLITNQHTFSSQPSLGHYYKLLTKNERDLNSILDIINDILNEKNDTEILDIVSINADEIVYKKCTTLRSVLDYSVSFRNKIAHGASFGSDDKQSAKTLEILDDIITNLEIVCGVVDTNIKFYHEDMKVFISDKNKKDGKFYELVPLVLYIECDKYICHDNHRTKLFFLNEAKPNQSYFLDYSLNHYFLSDKNHDAYQLLQKENKKLKQKKSIYTKHLAYSPTNTNMEQDLVSNFVGRENELNQCLEHIKSSKKNNKASFINIVGKPGIGKSSFVTLLKTKLLEDTELNEKMHSFIYYFSKDNLGSKDEEYKNFYNKLKEYIPKNPNTKDSTSNSEFDFTKDMEILIENYDKHQSKPLLLIIDGIDELSHPLDFIRNFSIKFSTKIHLIFTFRDYKYLKDIIRTKFESSCSRINILNQNSVLKDGYSIDIKNLLEDKVEELLYKVIPKDIKDNEQYNKIVQTIYERSEGLPLYIHYICEELKNNIANIHNDIAKNIIKWADKLPPDIAGFYTKRFEQLDKPMQREILLLIFYSKIPLDTMTIISLLEYVSNSYDSSIDEGIFEKDYFNHIEIFLKSNKLGEYIFYHNSVREALFEYLKKKKHIYTFDHDKLDGLLLTNDIEENSSIIDDFYYMVNSSSTYKFIKELVSFLKNNENENYTISKYYNNNFLHLYNRLIYIHMLQQEDCITLEDIQNKNYKSLKTFKPIKNKEIEKFFELVNKKKENNKIERYEIQYAYELALFVEDYDKVLQYKDEYKNYYVNQLIDICWNLDKEENKIKFKEIKHNCNDFFTKDILELIFHNRIISQFKEIKEEYKKIYNKEIKEKCYYKNWFGCDIETLESHSIENIDNSFYLNLVKSQVEKTVLSSNNKQILKKALEKLRIYEEKKERDRYLILMINKDMLSSNQILKFIDLIVDDLDKSKILISLIKKTKDKEMMNNIVNKASLIKEDHIKTNTLSTIAYILKDKRLMGKALASINCLEDEWKRNNYYKTDAIKSIINKLEDIELLQKLLNIDNSSNREYVKMVSESDIAPEVHVQIIKISNDENVLRNSLEVINKKVGFIKYEAFFLLIRKTRSIIKTLEMIDLTNSGLDEIRLLLSTQELYLFINKYNLVDDLFKKLFILIIMDTINSELLNDVLKKISFNRGYRFGYYKELIFIIKNVQSAKLLELVSTVIIENFHYNDFSLDAVSLIIQRANTKVLELVLNMITSVYVYRDDKLKTLIAIIKKTDDMDLLKQILKSGIGFDEDKLLIIESIINKTTNHELYEEIVKIFNLLYNKNKLKIIELSYLMQEKSFNNTYFNNIIFDFIQSKNTPLKDSLEVSYIKDSSSVLRYYNIVNNSNPLNIIIEKLKQINSLQNEDEQYEKLEELKQEIINDNLLEEFIKQYGELLNISNKSEFRRKLQIDRINLILSQ